MDNVTALAAILAIVTPYIVAIINRPGWSPTAKRLVMIGVSVVFALATAWAKGDFNNWDWGNILPYVVTFIGAVQLIYSGLQAVPPVKKALDKAEVLGSNVTPLEAARAKAKVSQEQVTEYQRNIDAPAA